MQTFLLGTDNRLTNEQIATCAELAPGIRGNLADFEQIMIVVDQPLASAVLPIQTPTGPGLLVASPLIYEWEDAGAPDIEPQGYGVAVLWPHDLRLSRWLHAMLTLGKNEIGDFMANAWAQCSLELSASACMLAGIHLDPMNGEYEPVIDCTQYEIRLMFTSRLHSKSLVTIAHIDPE